MTANVVNAPDIDDQKWTQERSDAMDHAVVAFRYIPDLLKEILQALSPGQGQSSHVTDVLARLQNMTTAAQFNGDLHNSNVAVMFSIKKNFPLHHPTVNNPHQCFIRSANI